MSSLSTLTDTIIEAIEQPPSTWSEDRFNDLSLRLFSLQVRRIPELAALTRARGLAPESLSSWRQLPAVPTLAFKRFAMYAGDEPPLREFHTSGTSGHQPGRALFGAQGMRAMAASIRVNARAMLLRKELPPTRILVLAPPPEAAPHMIMATGMAQLVAELGLPGSRFLVGPSGLDLSGLLAELGASSQGQGPPLTLIGASFGFVHLLDQLRARDLSFDLPEGSRLMDAGGFKGRSREVSYDDLLVAFQRRFGLPPHRCVNLLGMTELASQLYDSVLRDSVLRDSVLRDSVLRDSVLRDSVLREGDEFIARHKVCPPWVRSEVVDPETLTLVAPGQRGLLRHVDLANVDHPFVVQTDDLGERLPDGPDGEIRLRVLGRATADGSRGCSITVDELVRP